METVERGDNFVHGLEMEGREESTKVKLFLYIIGGQGRDIYDTLPFTIDPGKRTLKAAIDAFEAHCNPKKKWNSGAIYVFH